MPTLLARALAILSAAAMLIAGLAGPAAAGSEHHRDASHDVVSRGYVDDRLPRHPEPARRLGDITKNTVSYTADLVVTTKFRRLKAVDLQEFSWFVLASNRMGEGSWTASLVTRPGRDKGRFSLIDPVANQPGCGSAVVDRAARTVTLTIPGSCLGDPGWVRIANGVAFRGHGHEYGDDARRDGVVKRGWKYGPKVRP